MIFDRKLGGYVEVTAKGQNVAALLNQLTEENISLWNIGRNEDNVTFCVVSSHLATVRRCAHVHACEVSVCRRGGISFYRKYLLQHRYILFTAGAVLLLLWGAFSLVWRVEVVSEDGSGLGSEEKNEILEAAEECGLKIPSIRSSVNCRELAEDVLARCPSLSWVGVSFHGVTMRICVAERLVEDRNTATHGHIVAKKSGTVSRIFVWKGQKAVEPGDTVLSGDVLISGDIVYEEDGKEPVYDFVAAKGVVSALVCYEGVAYVDLTGTKLVPTGQKTGIFWLEGYDKTILLWGNEKDPFSHSVVKDGSISFFGWKLCFKTYCEATPHTMEISEREAKKIAEKKAGDLAKAQMTADSVLSDRKTEILRDVEGSIGMKVVLECEEEIGKFQALPDE